MTPYEEELNEYELATQRYYSRLASLRLEEQAQAETDELNWPESASGRSLPQNGGRPSRDCDVA